MKKTKRALTVKEMIMCCGTRDIFDIVYRTMQRAKPSVIHLNYCRPHNADDLAGSYDKVLYLAKTLCKLL
jgi:hypothetical protein